MEEAGIPGLAIAVVTSDSVQARGYGVRDANAGRPVTERTLFEAASLSKPLFARMVRMEARRGTLDLDTPLSRYFVYADLAAEPRADRITPRMVLAHRSGLPNWRRDGPLTIEFEPGSRFQYSGEGYVYLERALAHLRNQELDERAREMVLRPLGMGRSSFRFEPGTPDHALPHDAEGRPQEKRRAPPPGNPAASLHTSAADYGRFLQRLLRELREDPAVLESLTERPTPVADGVAWGSGWGLEFSQDRADPALWHWGDNGPFKAFVYLDPVADRGFVFFANSMNGLALTRRILRRLFPGPHALLGWLDYEQLDPEQFD